MKNLSSSIIMIAILVSALLSSCSSGVNPDDPIGLPAAFTYCATLVSYWVWVIIGTIVSAVALYLNYKWYKAEGKILVWHIIILFLSLCLLLFSWGYAPSEVAWNTTVEQAARGVYLR